MSRRLFIAAILISAGLTGFQVLADEPWLLGRWELVYDPDGAGKDWLEFLPDGDVRSSGQLGDVEGIYIITPKGVKAVFTYKEKDFIMNFHYDSSDKSLKIVTSHTGRESIYQKVDR